MLDKAFFLCYYKLVIDISLLGGLSVHNKSKQREAILTVLRSTKSHPTAEWIHIKAKEIIPKLSLGTVYRNLSMLVEGGEIIKVQGVFEKDRFDANPIRHVHMVCKQCKGVFDCEVTSALESDILNEKNDCSIYDFNLTYYGLCPNCNKI